jgi:tetratricopeptide (TPR) repeat protein
MAAANKPGQSHQNGHERAIAGTAMADDGERGNGNRLLKGWKQVAAYFGKDERTVRRWASTSDMPVHRVPGRQRAAVYAYAAELDAWLKRLGEDAPGGTDESAGEAIGLQGQPRLPAMLSLSASRATFTGAVLVLVLLVAGAGWIFLHDAGARTPDPRAQELYLQGVFQWEKRTPESLTKAVELFNRAVAIDADYAPAHAGLANAYNLLREYSMMPPGEAYAAAARAARRAVELDPSDADAHSALAFAEFYGLRQLEDGIERFELARRLDPDSAKIRHWFANALLHLGRFDAALVEINEAQKLDPASRSIVASKGLALFCAGQADEAIALLADLARSEPDLMSPHAYLAFIYLAQGDYPAFLESVETAGRLRGDASRMAVAAAGKSGLAAAGFRGMVAAMLAEERRQYEAGQTIIYNVARFEAMSGDWKAALASLSASLAADEEHVMMLNIDPAFRLIRRNPEFRQFAAGFGLPIVQ